MKNSRLGIFLLSLFTTTARAVTALALIVGLGFGVAPTVEAAPPGTPTNFKAVPGEGALSHTTLVLSWDNPTDTGGYAITGFVIRSRGESTMDDSTPPLIIPGVFGELTKQTDLTSPPTTYTDTRLRPIERDYELRVINANGETSVAATTVARTAPLAPTGLKVFLDTTSTTAILNWTASYNGGHEITYYEVERTIVATNPTDANFTTVATLFPENGGPVTPHTDPNLTSGTTYYYRVRATNQVGAGAWSTIETGTMETTAPTLTSITRATPSSSPTNADELTWRVTFSEPVTNVDRDDFTITGGGNATAAVVSVTTGNISTAYDVTASGGTLATASGTVSLALKGTGHGITDVPNNALTATTPTGANESYTLDNTGPSITSLTTPETTVSGDFVVTAVFSDASVTNFSASDVRVMGGTAGDTGGTGNTRTVTITPTTLTTGAAITVQIPVGAVMDSLGNSNAAASDTVTATFALSAPSAPTALAVTQPASTTDNTSLMLKWATPSTTGGTLTYSIERNPRPTGAGFGIIATTTSAFYTDRNLTAATRYNYRVSARNATDMSAVSTAESATTRAASVPGTPQNFTAVPSSTAPTTELMLTWYDPADTGGAAITGFIITTSTAVDGPFSALADQDSTTNTYTHTGLTAGTKRYYQLRVKNGAGSTPAGSPATTSGTTAAAIGAPPAPILSVSRTAATTAVLTWSIPHNGGRAITSYEVQRVSGAETVDIPAVMGADTLTTTDSIIPSATTTYSYRVRARNAAKNSDPEVTEDPGAGAWSSAVTLPRTDADGTAPSVELTTPLLTVRGDFEVIATFDEDVRNSVRADQITVNGGEVSSPVTGSGRIYTFTIAPTGRADATVTVQILANQAADTAGNMNTASNTLTVSYGPDRTEPSVELTTPATTVRGDFVVTATFNESVTGFVQSFAQRDVSVTGGTAALSGSGADYTITITPSGTDDATITVQILADVAMDAAGNMNTASNTLRVNYRPATVSGVPMGLTVTPPADTTSRTSLILKWTAPSNAGGTGVAIIDYRIERAPGASGDFSVIVAMHTTTSYTDSGLTAGTTYRYRVSARNSEGLGAVSFVVLGDTNSLNAPGAPTGLTVTAPADTTSRTSLTLNWEAPSVTGGTDITSYRIERGATSASASFSVVPTTLIGTSRDYTDTGLKAGTTYYYRVRAVNDAGATSTASVVMSDTTNPLTAPRMPTGLTVTQPTDTTSRTSLTLSWTAPSDTGGSDVTLYIIHRGTRVNGSLSFSEVPNPPTDASLTYTDTGLTAGTIYYYQVSARNAILTSKRSEVASGTTHSSENAPSAPTGLAVTQPASTTDTTSLMLGWTAPSNTGGNTIDSYRIERGLSASGPFTDARANTLNASLTYTDGGLKAGSTYHYRVSARSSEGLGAVSAVMSGTTRVVADTTAPTVELTTPSGEVSGIFTVTATFSETVTGFMDVSDVTVMGGTASAPTASGTDGMTYTFIITPTRTTAGAITVHIPANAAMNAAGNGNAVSETLSRSYKPGTTSSLAELFKRLNDIATTEVTRAITNQVAGAVAQRVASAGTGSPSGTPSGNLGGQSSLSGLLRTHGQAMMDDTLRVRDLLGNAEFVVPLGGSLVANATGGDASGLGTATFWGRGQFLNMEGDATNLDWDGELLNVQLGFDMKANRTVLGAVLTRSEADLDYTDRTGTPAMPRIGKYTLDYTAINPYISGGRADGSSDWWATVGYGVGEISFSDKSTDINGVNAAVGGSTQLSMFYSNLRIKGEHQWSSLNIEKGTGTSQDLEEDKVNASLTRVTLATDHRFLDESNFYVDGTFELSARYDGGDGATGAGTELGIGLRRVNAGASLTLASNARVLVGRDDYKEWGIDFMIRLDPGKDGQGLSINLAPKYGNTGSGVQQVWDRNPPTSGLGAAEVDNTAQLEASWGYGLSAGSLRGRFTPYGRMTLSDSQNTYSTGINWKLGKDLSLDLIQKSTRETANPDNAVLLKGELRF